MSGREALLLIEHAKRNVAEIVEWDQFTNIMNSDFQ